MNGTEQLDTYFVYDVKGNLCFVLQPEYQDSAFLDKFAFQYRYDNRNRCIWKKLPGAEYISYEYNDHDQLAFSQDGNQRAKGIWTFYVYDNLNRLTQQGESSGKNTSGTPTLRYYYDDYSFVGTGLFTNQEFVAGSASAKGKLTGCQAAPINVASPARTVYHYDSKGRMIKETASNALGGFDIRTITYTFTDQPATVTHTHTANGKPSLTEVYTYMYDHSDRISSVTHKLNSGSTVTLASYTYDNKGRLATKKLHGSSSNQLTYAYNIRSWITGITSSKFTQTLGYGSHYNGNISTMNWTANGSSHSYAFTYDGVNRMLNATHGTGAYTEKVTGYDKNGNITGLQRYGIGLIDNLTYTYNGNRLTKVEDATGNTAGFKNGASQANEYTYDNNGNLTKDLNKNISNIQYNSLNLPSVVTFSNGNTITYLYTADGRKLRTVHKMGTATTTTDYCGNVIYENGTQKLLLTEEGYINLNSPTTYYYYLKDHQGNNRVVVNSSGTVQEVNHYYPFGSTFATSNVQPYKYNGKELDTANGLNWYDYGARHYDAVLGRFTTQDRFAEKYSSLSPYQYGANSPVNTIDINGDSLKVITKEAILAIYNGLEKGTKLNIQFNNGVLDPNSIKEEMSNSSDFFLKDLYEIAINPKMVELSLSNINIFKKDGTVYSEKFGMPYDDDDGLISNKEELQALGIPIGRHIQGNLGQTLVPDINLPSGKKSTNNSVQILINSNGNLNHRTVGIAHEFGHVILYLRNLPFSHTQPGVDVFINKRATSMSKRLGYEY